MCVSFFLTASKSIILFLEEGSSSCYLGTWPPKHSLNHLLTVFFRVVMDVWVSFFWGKISFDTLVAPYGDTAGK